MTQSVKGCMPTQSVGTIRRWNVKRLTNMTQQTPRPLDGITVVSLEHAIAAPFCTRQLADLGARVI